METTYGRATLVRAPVLENVRQVEELVAGHAQGDHPDDPVDPDLRRRPVRFDLSPEVFARLRASSSSLA